MQIRAFHQSDTEAVVALWNNCGLVVPWNDAYKDIARKLEVNPEWFLVGEIEGQIIASCMVGYEGHRGWVNYLAVHPDHQRRGYASQLMTEAEQILKQAGCPKLNLMVRSSNEAVVAFYKSAGYKADEVVSLGKRLIADD